MRIEDRAPLSAVAAVQGTAWVVPMDGEPVAVAPGDVAIMRGPDPYTFAGDPATAPQAVIHPGQRCTTPAGEDLHDAMMLGVRSWGNNRYGSTIFLVGTYQMPAATSQRLLAALPPMLVVPREAVDSPLIALLDDEIVKDEPGQEVVLDRLLDLLLITVLRRWFAQSTRHGPAWYQAQSDPIVARALRLLHEAPAQPWTVAKLAEQAGVSRATLARRFTDLVGEPPMSYLAGWRLALAADLLREPSATVGSVARKVGYGSSFALSAAFKRVRGIAPRRHQQLT
ncbi:AraC family transcriptional regulator [Rhizocola hellebori]|uniref:AraC family transcriptional regulator n=1 Tax=Rhizocola hellebori TaxID=1392758 RepID=A0A8J3QFD7_9ACTN|nr:AraC family transcriptional regulator [Rhizocola hellebori]